jgi:hypothetical protein
MRVRQRKRSGSQERGAPDQQGGTRSRAHRHPGLPLGRERQERGRSKGRRSLSGHRNPRQAGRSAELDASGAVAARDPPTHERRHSWRAWNQRCCGLSSRRKRVEPAAVGPRGARSRPPPVRRALGGGARLSTLETG